MTKEVTRYPGGGVAVVEYEWGIMTLPPLIFAHRFFALPDMETAMRAVTEQKDSGFWHLVRRPVGEPEIYEYTKKGLPQ